MKKIIFTVIIFFSFIKVFALENIKINNESLSPYFETNVRKYNYFTDSSNVKIVVKSSKDENVSGSGIFEVKDGKNIFYIESDKSGKYEINVFKNYKKDTTDKCILTSLNIEGYDINFNSNKYDYKININDEKNLNINYETIGKSDTKIIGNGNFNKTDNLIEVICGNSEYKIHALKSINVSKNIDNKKEYKTMSYTSKEILKVVIVIISSSILVGYFYILFIKK